MDREIAVKSLSVRKMMFSSSQGGIEILQDSSILVQRTKEPIQNTAETEYKLGLWERFSIQRDRGLLYTHYT